MSLDARSLSLKIADAAWDKKAFDLKILNVRDLLQITDYFVICSGRTDRQVVAISNAIERTLRNEGRRPLSVEGQRWGRWICMDYDDVVVHIFYHEIRGLYALESLWEGAEELAIEEPEWIQLEARKAAGEI